MFAIIYRSQREDSADTKVNKSPPFSIHVTIYTKPTSWEKYGY